MQQNAPSGMPSAEQPQEEIELTELRPVKQSGIGENLIGCSGVTDAFRALRSISEDCREISEDYELRSYDYDEKKSKPKRKNDDTSGEDEIDKKRKRTNKSNSKKAVKNGAKRRTENADGKKQSKKKKVDSVTVVYVNDEEPMYLDLDKTNDSLGDEVYVFYGDSPSDSQRNDNRDDEDRKLDENETTDGVLFAPTRHEVTRDSTDGENNTSENTEELNMKIDAIIQENYRRECENNNVVDSDENRLDECRNDEESEPAKTNKVSSKKKDKADETGKEDQRTNEKKYCCVVCDAKFKGSGGLRNHYKVAHGAGPVFKCDECGKEFPLKERLKLHVRTHTGFKPYKCTECDKSFARGGQLVQHRRTHSQVKPYRCSLCSGTFTCAANLALHVKRHNGQKDHKCDICGRGFVRRDALKKHLECLHRDVKSFLCGICNKTFKGHLPQHMRTHARDRPHGCATCGQRFAQKSQLTVHQRTHSGQRPFRCLVCWQAFAHSTALKLHTRRHTGERPFKCTECNAGFTQLPHWKKHMKCIHGRNEPYSCKRCNSFFRIKNDLESHEKICLAEERSEASSNGDVSTDIADKDKIVATSKYRVMTIEKMRLLLAVLLKRISKQERLDELGFGKRLIDDVLQDSLISAGKKPITDKSMNELDALTKNLEIFLRWTVPKEHWDNFQKMKKTPEDILEALTTT